MARCLVLIASLFLSSCFIFADLERDFVATDLVDGPDNTDLPGDPPPDLSALLPVGATCSSDDDCLHGNCNQDICCAPGATCCREHADCPSLLACNTRTYECYQSCYETAGEDHQACEPGAYCQSGTGCVAKLESGRCDRNVTCISGQCVDGFCCKHAGLCCATLDGCAAQFVGCDNQGNERTQTCIFVHRPVPPTNQRQCYDTAGGLQDCESVMTLLPGQNGHYHRERLALADQDGDLCDPETGLTWHTTPLSATSQSSAANECANLSATDRTWRLPNRFELQTLVNYDSTSLSPYILEPLVLENGPRLWTSTSVASSSNSYWIVDFAYGGLVLAAADSSHYSALCVARLGAGGCQ